MEKLKASLTNKKQYHDDQLGDYKMTALELGSGFFQFDIDSLIYQGRIVESRRSDGTFLTTLGDQERVIEIE
ncbi:hypothetical protein [Furfurilactobacillus milii]|uniref:Uncharacterized protein n=1 Tax=Furfurilactobacillus milii TaxID=2888272 RepID=A0A6N9I4J6_9LACO|nr:hypothetical protein [Furfurilactobacillus milii]MYV17213.1 hypothetical protein [Furfurilactobacillus milii]